SGAPVPAPEQHPAQRDLARRPPAHASHRRGARGARSAAAGRVRLRGRAGGLRLWMAAQAPRVRPRHPLSAHLPDSLRAAWFVDWEFGGPPYANRALYEKWSPLNFVQNWKTPILIVHSQLDYRVDLSEGYQAFTAAKLQGVPTKFLYFPDEGHWVLRPRNRR